ncbi:hypothetical protein CPC08DRAFT_727372 [Agrocybe pediades]|nr:hypothetical protein CPC08DRAFT_727372 [Agrocybe pediades]
MTTTTPARTPMTSTATTTCQQGDDNDGCPWSRVEDVTLANGRVTIRGRGGHQTGKTMSVPGHGVVSSEVEPNGAGESGSVLAWLDGWEMVGAEEVSWVGWVTTTSAPPLFYASLKYLVPIRFLKAEQRYPKMGRISEYNIRLYQHAWSSNW